MKKHLLVIIAFACATLSSNGQTLPSKGVPQVTPTPTPSTKRSRPTDKSELGPKWPGSTSEPVPAEIAITDETARDLYDRARNALLQHKPSDALTLLLQAERLSPGRYEIENLLGVTYAIQHQSDDAISAFQKAIKLNTKVAPLHSNLCRALTEAGRRTEAVDECREAVRLDPDQTRFRTDLANLYLLDDRSAEALDLLTARFDRSQNDLNYLGVLADSFYYEGDYTNAADIYERISRNWPAITVTYVRLSGVYDYLGRFTDSINAARKFAELEPKLAFAYLNLGQKLKDFGFFDESIEPLEKATSLEPTSEKAFIALSEVYETIGDKDNMVKCLKRAYEIGPRTATLSYRVGFALSQFGYKKESIEPLERANALLPDQPDIMFSLGMQYINIEKFDEGIDLVERSLKIRPLPSNMSVNLSGVKKRNEFLAHYDEMIVYVKAHPENIRAHHDLAEAYQFKGMLNEAEHEYLEILKLAPDYKNYNGLAIFYGDHGQYEKAIDAYRKAIELNPHHVLYASLSFTLQRLGRLDEAIDAAKKAVEIKPDSLDMHLMLGELLLKKGLRDEALHEYQTGFDLASGDDRPNFRLVWLYIRMGNKQGALRHYEILKGIRPSNELANLELCLRAHFGPLP